MTNIYLSIKMNIEVNNQFDFQDSHDFEDNLKLKAQSPSEIKKGSNVPDKKHTSDQKKNVIDNSEHYSS